MPPATGRGKSLVNDICDWSRKVEAGSDSKIAALNFFATDSGGRLEQGWTVLLLRISAVSLSWTLPLPPAWSPSASSSSSHGSPSV
ncbi:unnamed protein product [Victoria cruziana]